MKRLLRPPRLKARPLDAHKASVGRVLVVGGSAEMPGAPALAGIGALRAGAGLVRVAVPRGVQPTVAGFQPELLTLRLPQGAGGHLAAAALRAILAAALGFDALVLGPGAGRAPATQALLREVLARCPLPVIVDADALYALGGSLAPLRKRAHPTVLTPHEGEAARLLGSTAPTVRRGRVAAAQALARRSGAVVLLKGPGTLVTDGERIYTNRSGGPVLASAGTGDVLAGVVGAFLAGAQATGLGTLEAAAAAAYVHGLAAQQAAGRAERGVLAGDVARALPLAVAELVRGPR